MAKTYLDIVNLVLRDANEIVLNSTTFSNPVGIQAFTKEAVNRALMDIANASQEWDWLKTGDVSSLNSITTTADQQWYEFKTLTAVDKPYTKVDFDTFFIDDGSDRRHTLNKMTYDEWHRLFREEDTDPNDIGGMPDIVIMTNDNNLFGLTPVPDDTYTVSFMSWDNPNTLSAFDDEIPFPERFYNVIVARARYYLWNFKENDYQSTIAFREYEEGLDRMKEQLITSKPRKIRLA